MFRFNFCKFKGFQHIEHDMFKFIKSLCWSQWIISIFELRERTNSKISVKEHLL